MDAIREAMNVMSDLFVNDRGAAGTSDEDESDPGSKDEDDFHWEAILDKKGANDITTQYLEKKGHNELTDEEWEHMKHCIKERFNHLWQEELNDVVEHYFEMSGVGAAGTEAAALAMAIANDAIAREMNLGEGEAPQAPARRFQDDGAHQMMPPTTGATGTESDEEEPGKTRVIILPDGSEHEVKDARLIDDLKLAAMPLLNIDGDMLKILDENLEEQKGKWHIDFDMYKGVPKFFVKVVGGAAGTEDHEVETDHEEMYQTPPPTGAASSTATGS